MRRTHSTLNNEAQFIGLDVQPWEAELFDFATNKRGYIQIILIRQNPTLMIHRFIIEKASTRSEGDALHSFMFIVT